MKYYFLGCCMFLLIIFLTIFLSLQNFNKVFSFKCLSNCNQIPRGFPIEKGEYSITAGFYDINYYKEFHIWHTGIDLIPNNNWYKDHSSNSSIDLKATITGKLIYYYSSCGGNAAIIFNASYLIYLGHISKYLVQNNSNVKEGDSIAVMGKSGTCQTGKHVHYEIHKKIDKKWKLVNPMDYLN